MENEHEEKKPQREEHEESAATQQATDESGAEKSASPQIDNKTAMGILCYLGILVIIPIVLAKDSKFVMYHANQGLVLLIAAVIVSVVAPIPIIGWAIGFFGWIAVVILAIMGIINVTNEKKKPLPLIGGIKLI
ncbi:MAG: hypothetical protein WD335_03475 [Candidatus Paceibacterota bacterium]